MTKSLLIILLLCGTAFSQLTPENVVFTQVDAVTAKAAQLEPMADRVAVFLTDPDPERRTGLTVAVKSEYKFVGVLVRAANGPRVTVGRMKSSGAFFFFGKPGKYDVDVIESDPEKGLFFNYFEAEIKVSTTPPPIDQPPIGGFEKVREIAKTRASLLNDPVTAKRLAKAYRNAVAAMNAGKSLVECQQLAQIARRDALNARTGESRLKDWNGFLLAVDGEVIKVVNSAETYKAAVLVIAEAIE